MSPAGATPVASRVLVVGSDADVTTALHLHLDRAGHAMYCVPGPADLETFLRVVAPHVVVLMLPASPDAAWGGALTAAAGAARVGVRVVMIGPAREIVEPLAAVAGAERALSRAEALARPLLVVERTPAAAALAQLAGQAARPPAPPAQAGRPSPPPAAQASPALSEAGNQPPLRTAPAPAVDLMTLIDEELVDEPRSRPAPARVEVNVSLVSEHNFYVGSTRHIDSGGVFIATALPPVVGTRLQVRLGLADGRKIDLEGEVAFVREKNATTGRQPTGCGVKLMGLPGWASDAIDRFVMARQPIVYAPR
ncbi:MAG: PilZ domain-containing protein [Anaeromyxobacter sp.]|nr:PilZ domain-containing protein [Anaeromyxobacter sp.]MBL0278646.1 PilZ domain-containing protein [Anaeromyxobacter sp.]